MILRTWRGYADPSAADRYQAHLLRTVRPQLESIPGFRGLFLLRRQGEREVEYVVQTLWDSMDAVRAFAGSNPQRAVVDPAAVAALVRFDDVVEHYEVLAMPGQ